MNGVIWGTFSVLFGTGTMLVMYREPIMKSLLGNPYIGDTVSKLIPISMNITEQGNIIKNTTITNPYILEVPLIISITGEISNPIVSLFDESGKRYNMVDFTGTTLTSSERIVINSAIKKIYKVDIDVNGNEIAGTEVDYRPEVNPEHDTYLFAKKGTSIITLNIDDTGTLEGTWRQYTL